uniref:Similar to Alpha-1,4 glucan phosphorylase L-1 isozyme, chloroplastic/amyloplastic n=1 Tax=Arundo donax TaxID=35708 RepID=A0A0A9E812_ARUDO
MQWQMGRWNLAHLEALPRARRGPARPDPSPRSAPPRPSAAALAPSPAPPYHRRRPRRTPRPHRRRRAGGRRWRAAAAVRRSPLLRVRRVRCGE